jgi:putative addiction module component (TIGR02574 family)
MGWVMVQDCPRLRLPDPSACNVVGMPRDLRQGCYACTVAATDRLDDLLRLPVEERAKLALELLRTLDGESEPGAAEAWEVEVERRGAEVDAGTAETMTLDEYRAHVRQRRLARTRR